MSNAELMTNDENRDVIPSEVEAATQRTKSARPGFQSRGNCVLGSAPGSFDSAAPSLRMTDFSIFGFREFFVIRHSCFVIFSLIALAR
jgi:hypothetical protein